MTTRQQPQPPTPKDEPIATTPLIRSEDSASAEVASLRQELLVLQQQVASQQAQIAALVHQLNQPMATPVEIIEAREAVADAMGVTSASTPADTKPAPGTTTSRRGLLRWSGLGAAAAL